MSLPIVFRRAARAEFDEAADWYEQRQSKLGMMFMAAVQRILDVIASQPKFYPQVYQDEREALVSGYPFCIYYREEAGRVVVLAVFHTSRGPSIWHDRA